MGYWPAKLICFLNIVIMVGYGTIACIISGQVLSAVSGGSMSIIVGIVVTALITWIVAVFGMGVFQTYERSDNLYRHQISYTNCEQMGRDPASHRSPRTSWYCW